MINLISNDINTLNRFIDSKKTNSTGSAKGYQSAINRFLNFINKSNLQNITMDDAEDYFTYLNNYTIKKKNKKTREMEDTGRKLTLNYKNTQIRLVHSFFEYFTRRIRRTNPSYFNPIPTSKEFPFSSEITPSIEETNKIIENRCFTPEKIIKILNKLYYTSPRSYLKVDKSYFMIGVLLTFTGARISEIISVKIEDVNTDLRYLRTGLVDNAKKSNKTGKNPLYFCYPDFISYILSEYILDLKEAYPDTIWLFPGRNPENYIAKRSVINVFEKLNFNFPVKSHTFRRSIETYQLNRINNIQLHWVELLSNHSISSTVMKHYNQVSIEERVKLYDECLPKEYNQIIQFLENL